MEQPTEHIFRSIGFGLFGGLVAAGFSMAVAHALDLPKGIAGVTTGIVTAVILTLVRHRHGPGQRG
jgi:hypothetical protein